MKKSCQRSPQGSVPEFVILSTFISGVEMGENNRVIQNCQFCVDFKDSQRDLTMLSDSVIRLQLNLNTDEYKVMHLGGKKKPTTKKQDYNHTFKIIDYRNYREGRKGYSLALNK